MLSLAALYAALFATIHLFIGKAVFLNVVPRSAWLSMAGGASTAYVFVYLLPKLADAQGKLRPHLGPLGFLDNHIYFVAVVGLAAFYGVDRVIQISNQREREGREDDDRTGSPVFWLHIGSFTLYNVLIGYLLLGRGEEGTIPLTLYFVAMALHLVTTNFGLFEEHPESYQSVGRWLLTGAVLLGAGIGALMPIDERLLGVLLAVLAGGIVLNVLREELPEARESRFRPFFAGAVGYGLLLMAV